jgi:Carboxypeptidase regulatory-like domain
MKLRQLRDRLGRRSMPLLLAAIALAGCGGEDEVAYSEVQSVWEKYGCTSCHPGVNPSLDLRDGRSYDDLVGVAALEDPSLVRVVAGDPERSFLYLKLGGEAPIADIPAIGTRMPPRAPPIAEDDLELVRRWIEQGAKNEAGETGGPRVATPGTPPTDLDVAAATQQRGSATIAGSVVDQRRRPLAGALVTMLLTGETEEGGEEHYRVAITDDEGEFALREAPAGRYLLKAYAPETIYVSRIVALDEGETQRVRFGLPDRRVPNPAIADPRVEGRELSMNVTGSDLDGNYTLAVNRNAGLVFELRSPANAPGRWDARIDEALGGPWIFLAVDENCNVSEFLTVGS